ncbi:MAG: low molecular weight phosphotyrosine protein phosphatase [Anaerotignum sp.]|nr:low molecular weight phosphotyrosine protein phosphatase [Anaerotignum sp.]
MIKVLFICHGNICRSPMAEYLFRDMVKNKGIADQFHIASAATSREEIGNGIYPPARRKLASVGINADGHSAKQVTKADYTEYDFLIVMERYNIPNLMRQIKEDPQNKVFRLLDFTQHPTDIADPWYTGDFDRTHKDIMKGLEGFLAYLQKEGLLNIAPSE